MNVRRDIEKFAKEEDKPILNWLLDNYSRESQWKFVAFSTFEKYGKQHYQHNRVWAPSEEGRILYANRERLEEKADG